MIVSNWVSLPDGGARRARPVDQSGLRMDHANLVADMSRLHAREIEELTVGQQPVEEGVEIDWPDDPSFARWVPCFENEEWEYAADRR